MRMLQSKKIHRYIWSTDRSESYTRELNSGSFITKLNQLSDHLSNASDQSAIDENVNSFNNLLDTVCGPLFKKEISHHANSVFTSDVSAHSKSDNKWFNEDCRDARLELYRCLNLFRNDKSEINCKNMTRARSIFKSNVRKAKFTYAKQQTRKLENMRFKNAKEYWKLLKNAWGQRKASGVSANNFYDYFKAINNPDDRFFQPDDDIIYFNERIVKDEFQVMFQELDVEISMGEINKAVKNLEK